MGLFKRLNSYFIADQGEDIAASDLIVFWGVMLGLPTYAALVILI